MKAQPMMPPAPALEPGRVVEVPLDLLCADPDQPRRDFDPAALDALAADIKARGVESPIHITSAWTIKHGERRFRAAKLAGLKTIPCLVLDLSRECDDVGARDGFLDQAVHNDHQRRMTPMDWAYTLRRLVDRYGATVGELPELLAARGVELSRPYISNLMRLLELPAWAQQMITAGKLNATHGKEILVARDSEKVLKRLEKDLVEWDEARDGAIAADDVISAIDDAFEEAHPNLNKSFGDDAPKFNVATCKGCEHRKEYQGRWQKRVFCLNKVCFDDKQAKATARAEQRETRAAQPSSKPAKPQGPTAINEKKIDANGVVTIGNLARDKYQRLDDYNVNFEPAMHCAGCPHNRLAIHHKNDAPVPTCFNLACFADKQRNGGREERIAQWLDGRVRDEVLAKLAGDHERQFQLLAWMALRAPTQTGDSFAVGRELEAQQHRATRALKLTTPFMVIGQYLDNALDVEAIAAAGVRAMQADRATFYAYARHLGVKLTPAIAALDRDYLEAKRKAELLDLARLSGLAADVADLAKQKTEAILDFLLSPPVIQAIGVPPDVARLYQHLEPALDPDDEDLVEEENEDDNEEDTDVNDE